MLELKSQHPQKQFDKQKEDIEAIILASKITFHNSHMVAYTLAMKNPEVAKALYEELKVWHKRF